MNKRIGMAIYPEIVGAEETIKYLIDGKEFGFSVVFANLLELENNEVGNKKLNELSQVYKKGVELGYEVIVDVNPAFYREFKLQPNEIDFFAKLGITGIRLDVDFGGTVEAEISRNDKGIKLSLNASSGYSTFEETIRKGGIGENIVVCHNFYPMKYTGLDHDRFIELSGVYRSRGARVQAFVTLPEEQKGIGPWNVNQGMPTLEEHRFLSLEEQVRDLLRLDLVDDLLISQHRATREQMQRMKNELDKYASFRNGNTFIYDVTFNESITDTERSIALLQRKPDAGTNDSGDVLVHGNRPDYNEFFVRSTMPRIWYKYAVIEPKNSGNILEAGDVVILNSNLGRYKGEIHIIKKRVDDRQDNGRNLIGKINKDDLWKLDYSIKNFNFKLNEVK